MAFSLSITQAISIMMYISEKMRLGKYSYLSTKYISDHLGIPSPSVSKIVSLLLMSGLIETKEGVGGGITLKKSPQNITVLDIFLAVERDKPLFKYPKLNINNERVTALGNNLKISLDNAENAMKKSLESVTLSDLISENK